MSTFESDDYQGTQRIVSNQDVILEADRDQTGAGDLVFRTGGVERARINYAGVGTGWPSVIGGSLTVLYVEAAGSDGNTGLNVGSAKQSLAAAISALPAAGGIIKIGAGTFSGAGTAHVVSDLVIEGLSADQSILSAPSGSSVIDSPSGGGITRLTLRRVMLDKTGNTVDNAALFQDATDVVLEDVVVVGGRWGIQFLNVTRPSVRRLDISGQAGAAIPVGLYVSGTSSYFTCGEDVYVHDGSGLGIFMDSTTSSQTILGHRLFGPRVYNVTDNGIRVQTANAHGVTQTLGADAVFAAASNPVSSTAFTTVQLGSTVGLRPQGMVMVVGQTTQYIYYAGISGNNLIGCWGIYGVTVPNGSQVIQFDQRDVEIHGAHVENVGINCLRINGRFIKVFGGYFDATAGGQGGIRDTGVGSSVLEDSEIHGATCIGATTASGGFEFHLGSRAVKVIGGHSEGWAHGFNGQGTDYEIEGLSAYRNNGAGAFLQGVRRTRIRGGRYWNNGQGAVRSGIEGNSTAMGVTVVGAHCYDDQPAKTQQYGVLGAAGSDRWQVGACDLAGNAAGTYNFNNAPNVELGHNWEA